MMASESGSEKPVRYRKLESCRKGKKTAPERYLSSEEARMAMPFSGSAKASLERRSWYSWAVMPGVSSPGCRMWGCVS